MSSKLPALSNLPIPALTDLFYIVTPGIDPLGSFNITYAQLRAALLTTMPEVLEVNVTPVGNVGAGTDNLMSFSVPANTLAQNGDSFSAFMEGTLSAQDGGAGDQRTLTWSYGGNTVDTRITQGVNAICRYQIEVNIFRKAASGVGSTYFTSRWDAWNSTTAAAVITTFEVNGLMTIDHTAANTFLMTGASTDAVNNDVVQNVLRMVKYPGV